MVKLLGTWSCFIEAVHPVSPLHLYQYIHALQLGKYVCPVDCVAVYQIPLCECYLILPATSFLKI